MAVLPAGHHRILRPSQLDIGDSAGMPLDSGDRPPLEKLEQVDRNRPLLVAGVQFPPLTIYLDQGGAAGVVDGADFCDIAFWVVWLFELVQKYGGYFGAAAK